MFFIKYLRVIKLYKKCKASFKPTLHHELHSFSNITPRIFLIQSNYINIIKPKCSSKTSHLL